MTEVAYSAAAERNKHPILERLLALLPPRGHALEIASGTGQHLAWFAQHLPQWTWQPTDLIDELFPDIQTRVREAGLPHVRSPLRLDVRHEDWFAQADAPPPFDLIYCANMLHIAPWPCCAGLMRGAAQHLAIGGRLVTYGPYLEDGVPTAEGNRAFDLDLRRRNPAWGLRRREDVEATAASSGLLLVERHALPANNLLLVWAAKAAQ